MKRKKDSNAIAVVHIDGVNKMTSQERHEIALWLRRLGAFIERDGDNFAPKFRARKFE